MCSIQTNIGHLTSTMQRSPVYGGFAIGQNFFSFNRELQEDKVVVIDDFFELEAWYRFTIDSGRVLASRLVRKKKNYALFILNLKFSLIITVN